MYKAGFYDGVLKVGEHAGKKVSDAKPLLQKKMIDEKLAIVYHEPEGMVGALHCVLITFSHGTDHVALW